ncbi:MAG: DUF2887 domain-containing protein [Desulfobacteraceae bacterium]|nr:DUF2887 domain-containing protein [Desulfobacteraceae bacterium]
MKTDTFFYELFRIDPRSLFELVGLDMEGEYIFESITVKDIEKRFDGYMKRTDGTGPNVFVEFQGYPDQKIYWRIFREIATWYEKKDDDTPFVAIVIFVDKKYKPKKCPLSCVRPNRMIRVTLEQCLKQLGDKGGVLTVLKPFGLSDKEELPESIPQWTEEIESLELPKFQIKRLTELLEYFILQCFQKLTLKEVRKMMLTPLEETTAVKELMQIKSEEWKKEGKKEIATNMLKMGMDVKTISKITGLSEKEIKHL